MLGKDKNKSTVYLIDYGISRQYRNPHSNEHIKYSNEKSLIGTPRYASVNTHLGAELSRRDDIESLAYCMFYLWKGSLPWQGLCAKNEKDKHAKIMDMKMGMSIDLLCQDIPEEFGKFLFYARNLDFVDKPDYKYLHSLINTVKERVIQNLRINKGISLHRNSDTENNQNNEMLDCL